MEEVHEGKGHGDVDLTLADRLSDGSVHYRTWTICECSALVQRLRQLLPEPASESIVPPDVVRATAAAVLRVPGATHLLGETEGS